MLIGQFGDMSLTSCPELLRSSDGESGTVGHAVE